MSRTIQAPPGPRTGHTVGRGPVRRPCARPDTSCPAPPAPPAHAVAWPARPGTGRRSARRPVPDGGVFVAGGPPAAAAVPGAVPPYPPVPEADRASTTAEAHQASKTAAADAAEETS
ncbi:hypothetical protein ACWC3X_19820 [Streptomyces populi]